MTTEMGPRDVDLGVTERVAGHCVRFWAWVISLDHDDPTVRFDPETATARITGESEYSGDAFARGRSMTSLILINAFLMYGLVGLIAAAPVPDGWLLTPYAITSIVVMIIAGLITKGSIELVGKTDVIDHTTEPAPDALDDLQQQYVDGEIDESELGERAAEVWER